MTDQELLRYSRHILMPSIGVEGQEKLRSSSALVVGCGGLGSPAAMYLASSGLGRMLVVDPDEVELTNLQRQIAHNSSRLSHPKASSMRQTLQDINPDVQVHAHCTRADSSNLSQWLAEVDVVLDCTDNFATRQAINAACHNGNKPLVSASVVGLDAQVTVFDPTQTDSPCYACVFPPGHTNTDQACATMGVLAPLVGLAGSLQASAALELLVQGRSSLCGKLALIRAWPFGCDFIHLSRQSDCAVCGKPSADC
jgi:molybdopterin/thiamine biosynthesis adenylyltransferase